MVRESISYLRKNQFVVYDDEQLTANEWRQSHEEDLDNVAYLQWLIDQLPQGYKAVFVLVRRRRIQTSRDCRVVRYFRRNIKIAISQS